MVRQRRRNLSRIGSANPSYVHSREYAAFYRARRRCIDPEYAYWPRYGGRGIKFLFKTFQQFFACLGPKPSSDHSLDRINNDGNYAPGNCRWATASEQRRNCSRFGESCVYGHPYSEDNLLLRGNTRVCLICKRNQFKKWYALHDGAAYARRRRAL